MPRYVPLLNYEDEYEIYDEYPYAIRRIDTKREIQPWFDNHTKYDRITLWKNNKKHNYQLHRLIALQFLPRPDSSFRYVRFEDGNSWNYKLENLYWSQKTH